MSKIQIIVPLTNRRSKVRELRLYAENADKRYFTLQEEGVSKQVWGNWFAGARLATALADGSVVRIGKRPLVRSMRLSLSRTAKNRR